jgi:hypothetical protein
VYGDDIEVDYRGYEVCIMLFSPLNKHYKFINQATICSLKHVFDVSFEHPNLKKNILFKNQEKKEVCTMLFNRKNPHYVIV